MWRPNTVCLWHAATFQEKGSALVTEKVSARHDPKKLFTIEEVAEIFGVSERTVWRRAEKGKIAIIRPIGSPRVTGAELNRLCGL